jgi:SAM-dependent MidA family methyltransferase
VTGWQPWQQAWHEALYGPGGFFTADPGPAGHFRTAVHAAPALLAGALTRLAIAEGCTAVLDVGAGRGELLTAITEHPDGAGLRLHGLDVVPRPDSLPDRIAWTRGLDRLPDDAFDDALVVAWELLDDVPGPVLELDDDDVPRVVLVDPVTGRERLGDPAGDADLDWCQRWWPLVGAEPGDRIEIGAPRDAVWADLIGRAAGTDRGAVLLAVDYAHRRDDRPPVGSLTGFRLGRAVPPVPDGSCDLTAHVALDAVAAAGELAGATGTRLTDQATALRELGVGAAPAPDPDGAQRIDGVGLLQRLVSTSEAAELLDRGSLGGFGWLLQRVRRPDVG